MGTFWRASRVESVTRRPRQFAASEQTQNALLLKTRFQFFSLFQATPAIQQTARACQSLEVVEKLAGSRGSLEARTPFLGSSHSLPFLGRRARDELAVCRSK